ncbi:MAG: aminotransferase class I/II-fold pyridoxal phosphate-dependent enzyme [Candidatus Shapirobacteria bacterium]
MNNNIDLDFSQNLNVFDCPKNIISVLKNEIDTIDSYPSSSRDPSIEKVSRFFNVNKDEIALGNGTTEIIFNLPTVLPKGKVVILLPSFWEYKAANKRTSENIVEKYFLSEDNNFELDFADFNKTIKNAQTVYLCNPNNPTSTILDKNKILNLITNNPNTNFVIDETYLLFRNTYNKESLSIEAPNYPNLFVVTSVSKFFRIPGMRIGFLVSNKTNIEKYHKTAIPYTTNRLVESILPHIFKNKSFISKSRKFYEIQRQEVFNQINNKFHDKLKALYPQANFILVKILDVKLINKLFESLKRAKIQVRNGIEFEGLGKEWLRINIKTNKENKILFEQLNKTINNEK